MSEQDIARAISRAIADPGKVIDRIVIHPDDLAIRDYEPITSWQHRAVMAVVRPLLARAEQAEQRLAAVEAYVMPWSHETWAQVILDRISRPAVEGVGDE